MTDHYEQAIEAAIRSLADVEQQLAAARDANGRLTAQLVASELREKMLTDQVLAQAERIDDLEAKLKEAHRIGELYQQALIDAHGLRERYETELARRRAADG